MPGFITRHFRSLITILTMSENILQLIDRLTHDNPIERGKAAKQLSRLGHDARGAAVPLVRACADGAEEAREWAVAALEELGPPSASDVDALASLLSDENSDVGYWAATLLGRLEREAALAASPLATAVSSSSDIRVRQRAAWALSRIGPPAATALEALRHAANDDDRRLAQLAQRAIDQIGC